MKVLLVDDSRFFRAAAGRALTDAGYLVVCAADGEEALRIAPSTAPDVVVLDMLLPKLGGLEVLQSLKQNPRTSSIPVIAFSSLSNRNQEKLKNDGAAAYVEKSGVDSSKLVEVVKSVLTKPEPTAVIEDGKPATRRERRRFPRKSCAIPVCVQAVTGSHRLDCATSDVSLSGCYVKTMFVLPVGTAVDLRITLDEKNSVTAKGTVRTADQGVGNGIEFTEMSNAARAQLQVYLEGLTQDEAQPFMIIR